MMEDQGFLFIFDKMSKSNENEFWRCKRQGCNARLHINAESRQIVRRVNEHAGHDSNAAAVAANRVSTAVKRRAVETIELPSQIITQALQGIEAGALATVPNKEALRKSIQRKRKEIGHAPAAPVNLQVPFNHCLRRFLSFCNTHSH
jgi:hypothetical protein